MPVWAMPEEVVRGFGEGLLAGSEAPDEADENGEGKKYHEEAVE